LQDNQSDLALMREIGNRFVEIDLVATDPMAVRLLEIVRTILKTPLPEGEPMRKVIIFSEYVDTVRHLRPILETAFPEQVLTVEGALSGFLESYIISMPV
jgi:hypothetical protein